MRDERGSARPSAPPTRAKGVFINNRWPAAASGKPSAAVAPAGGKVFTAIVAGGEAGPPFNTLGAYRRRTMGALALLLLLAADAALGFFGFGRSLSDQLAAFGPPAGMIGLAAQCVHGLTPIRLLAARRTAQAVNQPQEIGGRLARISRQ